MALIKCPECGRDISDTAAVCPHCGYDMAQKKEDFVPVVKTLSKVKRKDTGKMIAELIGSVILLAVGVPLVSIGVGIVLIIIGVIGFFVALCTGKRIQQGECPYCSTVLDIDVPSAARIKCPKCGNVFKRNESSLESTHE